MYYFNTNEKENALQGRTITYVAKQIGITSAFLTSIMNGYRGCSKTVAYCVTKCLNKESEIENYFIRKEN